MNHAATRTESPAREAALEPGPSPILSDPNPGVMRWILHAGYDVAWILVIVLASPWWLWRCARSGAFRTMARGRLGAGLPKARVGARRRVLVHGVSVGEIKGAQALIAALQRAHPDLDVVVSTTTDNGVRVAQKLYPNASIVRFPIDVSFVVRRFLARIDPVCVVLVELEIWPNFLRCANRLGIPMAVVNGRITGRSFGHYRLFRNLLPQFNRISLLCVQDEEYAQRFEDLAADRERIRITGNIKVDGLHVGTVDPGAELTRLVGGKPGQPVIVAGSTHASEERFVVEACRVGAPDARVVLVPRHPERAAELARELGSIGASPQLLTALRAGETPAPARPVIVDTIGELEQVYGLADLVFVGGSLVPHGGQNVMEPAAQGKPVLHGPFVQNFAQEVLLLERAGSSRQVADASALAAAVSELLADPELMRRMSDAGRQAVQAQKGATARTLAALSSCCLRPTGADPALR